MSLGYKKCETYRNCDMTIFDKKLSIFYSVVISGLFTYVFCCCNLICNLHRHRKVNNDYTVELLSTSTQSVFVPICSSVTTQQNIDNPNLQRSETQSLIRDTLLRNSTASME